MPLRQVSTDTFRWSPSMRIEASQITAVHPQLSPRCVQWRGMCRSKTSGKPILTICPMSRATSSTRSVIITKSLCPRISWACCASCTLMASSSPKLQVLWREHSNCTSWAQRAVDSQLRPPRNSAFGLFVRRMGSYYKTYPTFDVLGTQFELVRSKAHENLHKLSPILYDTLVYLELMPYRELGTPEALKSALQGIDHVIIDATERAYRRSQDDTKQREHYSGKKNGIC